MKGANSISRPGRLTPYYYGADEVYSLQLLLATSQLRRATSILHPVPPEVTFAPLQGLRAAVTPRPIIRTYWRLQGFPTELALSLRVIVDLRYILKVPLIVLLGPR